MNEIIAQTLRDFSLDSYRPIIPRALNLGKPLKPRAGNLVKVITGMRRSGKSYRLLQEMDALITSGIDPARICYFNFEDDRLLPITHETGDAVLHEFYSMHPKALSEGIYLFLDEVQEMEDWGRWLRRIVDTSKATITVTGSSSKMLSTDIATEFRGRAIDFELLPMSLREVAEAQGLIAPGENTDLPTERTLQLIQAYNDYLQRGGFPAVQELPEALATPLLQSYAQRVVSRDVIERHNITRPRVATAFMRQVLGSNGKQLSIRKTENVLRSMGLTTSRVMLADILSYLEDAYLIFQVDEFSKTLSENTTALPKIYAIDPGLALANTNANIRDEGQRLEDTVYLELRRRTIGSRRGSISSYHTRAHGWEIDFVVGDEIDAQAYELYQITVDITAEDTKKREIRALWEAMDETGLDEGTLIVGNGKPAIYEQDGRRINQIPAWQWLLNTESSRV